MQKTRTQIMEEMAHTVQERREMLAHEDNPPLPLELARYNILCDEVIGGKTPGSVRALQLSWLACELDDTPPINVAPEGTEDVPPGSRDMVIVRLFIHPSGRGLEQPTLQHRRIEGLDPHLMLVAYEEPLNPHHVLGTEGEWVYECLCSNNEDLSLEEVLYLFNATCDDIRYRTGRFIMAALDDARPPEGVWVDTDDDGNVLDDDIDIYPGTPR